MRFGKRLAEVTRGRAHEPYISYKELKHIVSRLSSLIGGTGSVDDDDDGSSFDDIPDPQATCPTPVSSGANASGFPASCSGAPSRTSRLEAHQSEFFRRVDADVAQAKAYVQSAVYILEAQVGDWQASAIVSGILFTPDQLEEISAQLPFPVDDQQLLVEWTMALRAGDQTEACSSLLERYGAIVSSLNALLQYIEVNLTAIRKIFKKFEKKVPAELRIQNVKDYKAHHELYMPAMQDLLVTAVQIQRLVSGFVAPSGSHPAIAISQIGSESLALLSWLRGPAAVNDVLTDPPSRIDVYAKPASDLGPSAVGPVTKRPGPGSADAGCPPEVAQAGVPASARPMTAQTLHLAPESVTHLAHIQAAPGPAPPTGLARHVANAGTKMGSKGSVARAAASLQGKARYKPDAEGARLSNRKHNGQGKGGRGRGGRKGVPWQHGGGGKGFNDETTGWKGPGMMMVGRGPGSWEKGKGPSLDPPFFAMMPMLWPAGALMHDAPC